MPQPPQSEETHPARKPSWGVSGYGSGEADAWVAKGAWPKAPQCPCESEKVEEECVLCESFRCPRCERWCSWEMGHTGDEMGCPLCDDCCVSLDTPCMEEDDVSTT